MNEARYKFLRTFKGTPDLLDIIKKAVELEQQRMAREYNRNKDPEVYWEALALDLGVQFVEELKQNYLFDE